MGDVAVMASQIAFTAFMAVLTLALTGVGLAIVWLLMRWRP